MDLNWVVANKPTLLALDFDGVLHIHDGSSGPVPTGEPVPRAREFVGWALSQGYELIIFSCRALEPAGKMAIEQWLIDNGFPNIEVTSEKPIAELYIDDRGFRFEGDFSRLFQFLTENPKPGRWGKRV